jgi:aspartate aminotransferase
MDAFTFCNRVLGFVNAPALMQHVVRALQGASIDVEWYRRRRDYLVQNLNELGYSVVPPEGAFYLFPKSPTDDDVAFVRALQEEKVLVTPGRGFGAPGHFRISYSVEEWVLEGAVKGFGRVTERA